MGLLITIALRNMLRHKRRTVSSAITIAVGITFFLLMDSVLAGLDRGGIDNMINLSASAVKVEQLAYRQEREAFPLQYGITDFAALKQVLEKNSQVVGVTPRTRFLGQLAHGIDAIPVAGTVIEPATDSLVFKLTRFLTGSYLSGAQNGVVLGAQLASEMGLELGGYVTLSALTRYGSHNADEFKIVGLLTTTDPALNGSSVIMAYGTANEFLDLDGLITEADIALKRRVNLQDMVADAVQVKEMLQKSFPDYAPETFMESGASFLEIAKSKRAAGYVFLVLLLLIAGVGIFNTVLMSVYERIREVGVLRAHGLPPSQVTAMFVLEVFFTGVLGSTLGMLIGGLATWVVVVFGYPLDKILTSDAMVSGMPFWGTIYGEWNIPAMVLLFIFCTVVATVAGYIPARRAGKMAITEALRFV